MFLMWTYFVVAFAIALAAFAVAQLAPGLGAMLVAGATTMRIAYSAHRAARIRRR